MNDIHHRADEFPGIAAMLVAIGQRPIGTRGLTSASSLTAEQLDWLAAKAREIRLETPEMVMVSNMKTALERSKETVAGALPFFVSRRFMGRPHCLFGLQQVFGEPFQHHLNGRYVFRDGGQAIDLDAIIHGLQLG
jgi:hypothetical protein